MTTTAQTLIDRAAATLNDTLYTRWTNSEMIGWITDGQRELVGLNPMLFTKTVVRTLAAGVAQTLTDLTDYGALISMPRNMANDGVTPGRVITKIDPDLMDALDTGWQTAAQDVIILHYMFVAERRFQFRVVPPAVVGTKIEITYSAIPPAIAATTDLIVLQDHCGPALVDYLLFRAFGKDAEFGDVPTLSESHHKRFVEAAPHL